MHKNVLAFIGFSLHYNILLVNPVRTQLLYILYLFIFKDFLTFDNTSKRKRGKHKRPFQDSWTNDYLFIEQKGKPRCLVCRETVAFSKTYIIKRHYESFRKEKYAAINGAMIEDFVKKLQNSLSAK